jgi:hypothetical protein
LAAEFPSCFHENLLSFQAPMIFIVAFFDDALYFPKLYAFQTEIFRKLYCRFPTKNLAVAAADMNVFAVPSF